MKGNQVMCLPTLSQRTTISTWKAWSKVSMSKQSKLKRDIKQSRARKVQALSNDATHFQMSLHKMSLEISQLILIAPQTSSSTSSIFRVKAAGIDTSPHAGSTFITSRSSITYKCTTLLRSLSYGKIEDAAVEDKGVVKYSNFSTLPPPMP